MNSFILPAPLTQSSSQNTLTFVGTRLLEETLRCTTRFLVHQGGTRSSKTYSIVQALIILLLSQTGQRITIARKSFPSLRATAMRDFFDVLMQMNLYDERCHNKTSHTYTFGDNVVEFVSLDEPQKKRGAKRSILWMNEVNEFSLEDFVQLNLRTTTRIIMDFNPSDYYHWVYDVVLSRSDCTLIQSTYKDNPFLSAEQIREIELLQDLDATYWQVFGLGQRAALKNQVYSNWQITTSVPPDDAAETVLYGLDFGFHNPTALIKVSVLDGTIVLTELLYEKGLTNADLLQRLQQLIADRKSFLYADAAEPNRIEEIRRYGFNIHPADKAVRDGIDFVRRHTLLINSASKNLLHELQMYKWSETHHGDVLDVPVKCFDHALDAVRYALYTHYKRYGAHVFGSLLAGSRQPSFLSSFASSPYRRYKKNDYLYGFS